MANTSASGGYLVPASPPPVADLALDVALQGVIAGITGLPGDKVRPRVQPNDPLTGRPVTPIPNVDTDWCAVEVMDYDPDDMPAQIHVPDGIGYTILRRGDFAPLKPYTLAKRRERGNFDTDPLFDTAQMYAAVTYKVEPKK